MLNLKKKLLSLLLVCAMLGALGSTSVWSDDSAETLTEDTTEAAPEETAAEDAEAPADEKSDESEEEEVVNVTDEMALADCKLYAETTDYKLYVNEETAVFGFVVKASGKVWWSTPANVDNDPIAKGAQKKTMKSQFYWDSGDPAVHRTTKVTAFEGSVSKKDFTIEKVDNGVKVIYRFEKQLTTIPVQFTINEADGCLDAEILVNEIVEDNTTAEGGSMVLTLDFLPNFGAASGDENGYIVVPDGSGAVIKYNNGKTTTSVYEGKIYGRDYSIGQLMKPAKTEQVYMPVLGMVNENADGNDTAIMAVIDDGDEYGKVCANVSGQSTTYYNNAWFEFTLRASDTFYMGTNNRELSAYEALGIKTGNIKVKYFALEGDSLSYVDIANKYRDYLEGTMNITKKTTAGENPFYLNLFGGTINSESILGFPVDMAIPATTYAQAEEILTILKDKGINNILVTYDDFTNSGILNQVTCGADYSGMLGGKDGWKKLEDYSAANGITLYPAMEFNEFYNSGNGYSFTLNACKMITKAYSTQSYYERAFGTPVAAMDSSTILSPYYFPELFDKIIKSLQEENISTVSLGQVTTLLYSDYSRYAEDGSDYVVRGDSVRYVTEGLQKMKDAGISILADACNVYALPYVDRITNVPLYSSNFDLFDYDIPFYELVIHGLVPYTTKAINASANKDDLLLLALSTATPISYDMMYADPNEFADSIDYSRYFYTNYKGWIDNAAKQYELFGSVIPNLSDKQIVSHKYLSANEIETEFEDGTKIYVDTENLVLKVNGQQIDIAQYGVKGVAIVE